ncbi:serpentine type 7TM GPCR receptor class ab chemoreceptor domain-containing protein [Ditylenchus destructor]|uniref:Serpentine type 7TM GPCR receptor class ab chemoreceptor domain-containing protein n=1 Tax=Ditylenchus destructor TaxID=166010 RepID=A0AAD4MLJ6_9BILA|nr:serpentine type 7TM GPCR receptor class ab chemoreceptor domain-containing protein [Ditylenchus destructor]
MDNVQLNCLDAEILSQSVIYKILIWIKGLMNIAAVVIFLLLAISKIQAKIFHPNTKVVALSVCAFTFLMALQDSCFYIYELWRMTYPYYDPCKRLWTAFFLLISRAFHTSLVFGINSSLVVLCIERITCICRISNYEQSSKPILVVVILTVTTAVSSIGFTLFYMGDIDWNEGMAETTAKNKMNADKYQLLQYFLLAMQMLGGFCFIFIHNWCLWYRKRIRGFKTLKQRNQPIHIQSSQSLSVKFQIEETIRMTSLFLPVILLACLFSIFSFVAASISTAIWPKPSIDFQMITFELIHISHTLPFFIVLLLAHGVGKLRKFGCLRQHLVQDVTDTSTSQSQDDHFKRLNQLFETGDPKTTKHLPKQNIPDKNSRVFWTSRVSDSSVSMA